MSRIFFLFFLGLGIWTYPQQITISLEVAFDGFWKSGLIHPVWVTLKNNSNKKITGQVSIYQKSIFSKITDIYSKPINLPTPSQKILQFQLPLYTNTDLWAILKNSSGKIIATTKKQISAEKDAISLNIDTNVIGKHTGDKDLHTTHISTKFSPDHLESLQAVDVVFLLQSQQLNFTSQQRQVLLDWTASGGRVLFFNTALISQNTLLGVPVKPIVESYSKVSYGRGNFFYISSSIDALSTKNLLANKKFLSKELGIAKKRKTNKQFGYINNGFRKVIGQPMQIAWMVWLFVFYVLCIGPLDYWLSKKIKTPLFTWAFFIAMIFIFTSLAYLKSYWLKSGSSQLMTINTLDLISNRAKGVSFFSIYSTRNAVYDIQSQKPISLYPLYAETAPSSLKTLTPSKFFQKKNSTHLQVRIPIYSPKDYYGTWVEKAPFLLQGSFNEKDQNSFLKLQLPKEIKVKKASVVTKEFWYRLKENNNGLWKAWKTPKRKKLIGIDGFYTPEQSLEYLSASSFLLKNFDPQHRVSPFSYEEKLDLSRFLYEEKAVVLLFVQNSLNKIYIKSESPVYEEWNLLRLVVPITRNN